MSHWTSLVFSWLATAGDKSQRLTGPGPTSAPGLSPQTALGPTSDPLKGDLFPTPNPHM
ncbi:unnamed protein product, partial [Tenebrio molitor]